MKLVNIAALGLLALASVSSALQCPVGGNAPGSTCTMQEFPSKYNCYACTVLSHGYTIASYCDPTVTTGTLACIYQKEGLPAIYGACTW